MSLAERFGWRGRPIVHLIVGVAAIEVAASSGSPRSRRWAAGSYRRLELDPAASLPATIALLAADGVPANARGIRVVVADSWLAVGSVPWSAALKRLAGAEAGARIHLMAEGFSVEAADTVRIDDGALAEPQLAVAYGHDLLAALAALAERWGVPLLSVEPLSSTAWAAAHRATPRPAGVVAVLADGAVMLLRALGASGRRLNEVQVRAGPADPVAAARQAQDLWRRSGLRDALLAVDTRVVALDLTAAQSAGTQLPPPFSIERPAPAFAGEAAPSALLRLAASAPGHRVIDAVPERAEHGRWRWGAVAAGLVVFAVLAVQAGRARDRQQELGARLAARTTAPIVAPRREPWSREEAARAQAVNAAVRELNLPIAALLDALQPPRDIRVAVLSVETSESPPGAPARLGGVRIVAEARGSADMARYASYVADSKPFVSAYVVRHEVADSALERPLRFTLEASWSD